MSKEQITVRIGIFGHDPIHSGQINRHPGLWEIGYAGSLTHVGAVPVELCSPTSERTWGDILEEIDGILFAGFPEAEEQPTLEEDLCRWCRDHKMPLLAIDRGLLRLNTTFGGTLYNDLPRELPDALQHRHPPEEGIRHAINVLSGTYLERTYGEGEIIVNSEHRQAVERLGRGFRISGEALDGVVEAIEWVKDDWFALGIQWQPASATSSGLDIQVFRTLVDMAIEKVRSATQTTKKSTPVLSKVA